MKIIELNNKNPYSFQVYENLNNILQFGYEYFPKIFLEEVDIMFEGRKIQIPRWITKLYYDSIDKDTQELMQELNQKLIMNNNFNK